MFNCYSREGGGGDQEWPPARHRNCIFPAPGQPVEQLCLHLELPLLFHRDSSLSLLPPPHNLFHPSTPHRSPSPFLAATTRPRSLLSAAVSINPPSPTLFNGRAFTPRATVFPAETSFRDPAFSFRKDRAGRARRIYAAYVLRLSRFSFIGFWTRTYERIFVRKLFYIFVSRHRKRI